MQHADKNGSKGLILPVLPFALTSIAHVHEDKLQQWIGILLGAYGAGAMIGSPFIGYWADRAASRRIPYLIGLIALAASMIAFSIGRIVSVLVIGRLVQGASAASVHSVGTAILADTFTDGGMGPMMGILDMGMALGTVLGPVFGGLLYHRYGYFAVFQSAYILIALDFALRLLMLERNSEPHISPEGHSHKLSPEDSQTRGQFESGSADEDSGYGEISSLRSVQATYGSVVVNSGNATRTLKRKDASPSSANSAMQESPSEEFLSLRHQPIIELLFTPRMQAALLGDFMQSVIITGLESVLPLRIKTIFHYNSKGVALVFLVLSLPSFAAPLMGYFGDKLGARKLVSIGFAGLSPLLVLLRMVHYDGPEQVVLLCALLWLIGISLNMILTPLFSDVTYLVDDKAAEQHGIFGQKKAYAQAYALMGVAYASGSLIGPLLGGLEKSIGWNNLTLGAGFLCMFCAVPSFFALGGRVAR